MLPRGGVNPTGWSLRPPQTPLFGLAGASETK